MSEPIALGDRCRSFWGIEVLALARESLGKSTQDVDPCVFMPLRGMAAGVGKDYSQSLFK